MKIKPSKGEVQIKMEEAFAGTLDTSSRESAVEYAEVIAVGEGVTEYVKGDFIFVKSWAIDRIDYKDKVYRFISVATHGIKAKVQ